ncbi:CotD family spore coat protein [Fictibacillus barbaricus]|uniref:Spore coat protein D n=1 Tax=Fictibacillus barbaricus TaxID=182136 RepID=A0ABU1TXY9_9BACL|nr:CotD family spore coat protein [Fictibacillus barbaricus]MDR7072066.1 spore coat protein D [Fictibacillus barbaricus]
MFKRPLFPKKGMGSPVQAAQMAQMAQMQQMQQMQAVQAAQMAQMQQPSWGFPQTLPSQYYPPQVLPAQVSPTNQQLQFNQQDVYVPMIHPTQNTQVNQMNYKYVHYFPQNTNVVNQATQQNLLGTTQPVQPFLCPPPCPCPCSPFRKK